MHQLRALSGELVTLSACGGDVTRDGPALSNRPATDAAAPDGAESVPDAHTGAADAGEPAPVQCTPPALLCDGACVIPQSSLNHCGGCGVACAAGERCWFGKCARSPRSCGEILVDNPTATIGTYAIDPDGVGPEPNREVFCDMSTDGGGWTRCFDIVNTPAEDLKNNDWLDDCVDWSMADWSKGELALRLVDLSSSTTVYEWFGRRAGDWSYDAITSSARPDEQYQTAFHEPIPLSNGDAVILTGKSGSNHGCEGSRGNGYSVQIWRSPSDAPRLLVMPYRHQVVLSSPREFGAENDGWHEEHEVSYDPLGYQLCGPAEPRAFLGRFEFYVR